MLLLVFVIPRLFFMGKGRLYLFVNFSFVFCLYGALHNRRRMSSNYLVFFTSGGISSRPSVFSVLIFSVLHQVLPL